jgi:hypothetical protein
MLQQSGAEPFSIVLYTDSHIVRGTILTRYRRMSDVLNRPDEPFIVLSDVVMDEWGSREQPVHSGFAQVNLASVLFAVADTPVEPTPELRLAKVPEQAFISLPPFKITGHIHLLPERDLREALGELTGGFIPVTEATYWSDVVGEAKQTAIALAFNHSRAQILAPHREVDPWAGLDRAAEPSSRSGEEPPTGPSTPAPATEAAPGPANPADDPWRDVR